MTLVRGCIGSLVAHQPLGKDVIAHAVDAATRDPRFNPVTAAEYPLLNIEVSVLGSQRQLPSRPAMEKKPLNHFHPGSSVLSFGTAGCNSGCRFCQNFDIAKARSIDKLSVGASPEKIAQIAASRGIDSVAFTCQRPHRVRRIRLGPDVPLHFSAFHPSYRIMDVPPTPHETLTRARAIALAEGLHYVYAGNVHDREGDTTYCPNPQCHAKLIERDWYRIIADRLSASSGGNGHCPQCGTAIAGRW